MAQVTVTINGRKYQIVCDNDQEAQLFRLGTYVDNRVGELVAAIEDYLQHYNDNPKPFVWTATVDAILKKVGKCKVILGTHH